MKVTVVTLGRGTHTIDVPEGADVKVVLRESGLDIDFDEAVVTRNGQPLREGDELKDGDSLEVEEFQPKGGFSLSE